MASEINTLALSFDGGPLRRDGGRSAVPAAVVARWARHPSIEWTQLALAGIEKYRLNPLRAARLLAHMHAALHDAWDACDAGRADRERCARIAQPVAAAVVLEHFFAEETPGRFAALALSALSSVQWRSHHEADATDARRGRLAGLGATWRATTDRADRGLSAPPRPAPQPGTWRPAPPLFAVTPTEQGAPNWRPWLLKTSGELQPPAPLPYGSEAYVAEVREVLEVNRALTPEQKRIADDWNLDVGTATPGGVWNLHALRFIQQHNLDLNQTTLLMTDLNLALADAFIACWHAKLRWWTERPVTEVRERFDPKFEPHIVTPPFPSYVSGHSTASGAAAAVIAAHIPAIASEAMRLAKEASMSRLYGGIHFRSDNEAGLQLGLEVGRLALQRLGVARGAASGAIQSSQK